MYNERDFSCSKVILLTGATGFLGSNLLRSLLRETPAHLVLLTRTVSSFERIADLLIDQPRITVINRDEIAQLDEIFFKHQIDTIIHCATDYGRKSINPLSQIQVNLMLPLELLELGRVHGIRYFINTDTILDKGISHYSLSKKQFKDWLESYAQHFVSINVSLEHFYGAFDDTTKFVSYIIGGLLDQVPEIKLTSGIQKRDFIYIEDVVQSFMTILGKMGDWQQGFYHFEVGTNRTMAIKDVVLLLKKLTNNTTTKLDFGALPIRANEVMESFADITAIKDLGWQAHYSIEDGLKHTIDLENLKRRTRV